MHTIYTNQYGPGMERWLDPLEPGEYPSADGQPMAESQVHVWTMMDTISPLTLHFQHRDDVHVGGNMMMYYVEGDPTKPVSPDVFVAFGPSREPPRDVWLAWEEGKFADFVLEFTSMRRKTRDEVFKPVLYRRLGVTEYWQFDPKGDYLDPPLKGRRLNPTGKYAPIPLAISPKGVRYATSKILKPPTVPNRQPPPPPRRHHRRVPSLPPGPFATPRAPR